MRFVSCAFTHRRGRAIIGFSLSHSTIALLALLTASAFRAQAQRVELIPDVSSPASVAHLNTTGCLNLPATFVPFTSAYGTTTQNTNGDRLVVGHMPLGIYGWVRQLPLPSTPNQQLCNPLQIAPGLYVQAYVPTQEERLGDFSAFDGLLLDPRTYNPNTGQELAFSGGIIPLAVVPDPFAWRISAVLTGIPAGTPDALNFVPITPCRITDTRNFTGGTLRSQTTLDFSLPNSSCNIPFTAEAYSLNFTVVPSDKLSYLTVFPTGQPRPVASTLNSYDGRTKANAAIVPAGTNGAVSVFTTDDTELIVDINGYFVSASIASALAFYPIAPCRLIDTRGATGLLGAPALTAEQERAFPIGTSACGVPAAAKAYSLNYTAVPRGPLGYLTTWPTGQIRPIVSTLNAPTGTTTANAAIVPAGDNGDISVYATQQTDLIVDISGYFAPASSSGLSLYNLTPCRVYDTRTQSAAQPINGVVEINVSSSACSVPASAQSYVFNATVIPANSLKFLTLWPTGGIQPNVSTLNALDSAVTSNMAITPAATGSTDAFTSGATHLIVDIFGYFAPARTPVY